jgi:hypothetical protein
MQLINFNFLTRQFAASQHSIELDFYKCTKCYNMSITEIIFLIVIPVTYSTHLTLWL